MLKAGIAIIKCTQTYAIRLKRFETALQNSYLSYLSYLKPPEGKGDVMIKFLLDCDCAIFYFFIFFY